MGVSSSGGYRYLRGEEREKETRGRKRKLDETIVNKIIHEIESQPAGEKTKSWEELCKIVGVSGIAPVTLKRAVEGAGYYKCSHCQRGKLFQCLRLLVLPVDQLQSQNCTVWARTKTQRTVKKAKKARTRRPSPVPPMGKCLFLP